MKALKIITLALLASVAAVVLMALAFTFGSFLTSVLQSI